jgi:exopolysaccharide biosynthesis polyprenyl glycosylphosphotransferase
MSAAVEPLTETTLTDTTVTTVPVLAPGPEIDDHGAAPGWVRLLAAHPKGWLMSFDAVAAALGFAIGPRLLGQHGLTPIASWAVLAGAFFLVAGTVSRLYQARFTALRGDEFRRIVVTAAWMAGAVVVGAWAVAVPVQRSWLLAAFASVALAVTLEREISRALLDAVRTRGLLLRRAVVIGTNEEARSLRALIDDDPTAGYRLVGLVEPPESRSGDQHLALEAMMEDIRRLGADSAVVAASALDSAGTTRVIRRLADDGLNVELTSTLRDVAIRRLTVRPIGPFPVMFVEPRERGGWRARAKRGFDLCLATTGLVLAAPVLAMVAVAIRLDSPGPVFFGQRRVGRNGRVFRVWKFRTMVVDAEARLAELADQNEADGPLFKMRDDPRITRVGRFLRKTSIDEIPQLWNVLRNEMSMVGPRPALPEEVREWDQDLHERLRVKPGITGMWQVHGRSDAAFQEYARLDLYYVHNWSLTVDLAIVARTIPTVLWSHGAY